jgi:hypothetical protein
MYTDARADIDALSHEVQTLTVEEVMEEYSETPINPITSMSYRTVVMLRGLPSNIQREVAAKATSNQARSCLHTPLHVGKALLAS